mmetsp:Transcript_7946/g.21214  ORF Transcript_7946/g.21214 Transcript_7946/m.21214 type:complete len:473 (+) Transcript_7946:53-1471(+)|eukprot:CAMPEP_0202370374 /NCGR_PEP_ID=MMETSP1127-20130417/1999_1 /ASSEMBLY_ACC=CAM_ASM_000462 /TAXON_ID=3047 /ORGANISM="Dunaliella tertiolecta, Strain CCMP1320" /LENGTH=472 /DNA_ID=CAMNT_0048966301 /DNA_START=10 /DNA_END=1428 /DNA_ORIENTATION=+
MGDTERNTTELTATQYVILAENQRKKKALADTKSQFGRVADENQALLEQLEFTQRENYEVTEHLREELLHKSQQVADLQTQIQREREQHAAELARQEESAAARQATIVEEANAAAAAAAAQIQALTAQLMSVSDFQQHQAEVEAEVMRLKEENQGLREKMESQRVDLERYYLELNQKQRKEWEQRLEELKKAAEEEVDERLDAAVKRILQQNRRMAEELKIHVQETDMLQGEVRLLEQERARLTREVKLKTELEEGYAKRGAKQAAAIKESAMKIATLEGSLGQVMEDAERERLALLQATHAQVSEAHAEMDALRRLVKLKTRELKNTRRLAQEVLLQRSDVETFLLSSLHLVRKEVERDSMREVIGQGSDKNGGQQGAGSKPSSARQQHQGSSSVFLTEGGGAATGIKQQPQKQQEGVQPGGGMDIRTLPWADRERVLKLLFAKINNAAQQAHYANLPPHILAGATAGQPQ